MKSLSAQARSYVIATLVVGGLLGAWLLTQLQAEQPLLLAAACVLAAIFQIFKKEGATARSSYNFGWAIYGAAFAFLGVSEAFVTILVAHLVEWVWHRYPWYIQSFNIATFAIATSAGGVVYRLLQQTPDLYHPRATIALVLAMAAFTLVNHLLVGLVIKLARGQSLAESGVFTLTTLTIDFGLLCLGISAILIGQSNPFAVVFIIVVANLLYTVLRVPALERKSEQDAKTGLYNDRYFDRAVHRELQRAQRLDRPLCVVMADLDHLRLINNTYGHLAGDAVLKKIAQILQASAREGDVVARFGGEEFGILMPNTTQAEAFVQVEAMRKAIEAAEFTVATSQTPIKATMSFGIAEREGASQTATEFICNADLAVYQAKHSGRNRTCVYDGQAALPVMEVVEDTPAVIFPDLAPARLAAIRQPVIPNIGGMPHAGAAPESTAPAAQQGATQEPTQEEAPSRRYVNLYVGAVALAAAGLAALLVRPTPGFDWTGLLIFALLAFILEALSTNIYARDTSVSTSVAPLLTSTLLFGPVGAVVTSLVITLASQVKHRKPFNRFVFNAGNHLIGSLLCSALILATGAPYLLWDMMSQIIFAVAASGLIYLSTTGLLAGVVALNTGQSFQQVWVERFSWLGLHYAALGMIAYALLFNYLYAGVTGVILLLVPLFMLHISQRQYINATKRMVDQLRATNAKLVQQSEEVEALNKELMLALASTIDLRDPFVIEHSRHVARYAVLTATELGLSPAQVELVRQAGLMHDIGKLAIPEAILFKPDFLTPEEYEIVKDHSTIGADLLSDFRTLRHIAAFVRHHHERYDGLGYPDGLSGDQIPIESRILALADAVEAMASDRPYRQGLSVDAILAEIARHAGAQFDPKVVEAFTRVVQRYGAAIVVNSARALQIYDAEQRFFPADDYASLLTQPSAEPLTRP
ncbi:MAG TPA: diguanylate cyclase [Caldilineaceae bacterium]|nr:diguanylate cyclase [Caldilineaceae bacterium]